jgi:hypothetical protein
MAKWQNARELWEILVVSDISSICSSVSRYVN